MPTALVLLMLKGPPLKSRLTPGPEAPSPPFPPTAPDELPLFPFEPERLTFAPTVVEAGVMLVVSELTSSVVSEPIAAAPPDTSPVQVVTLPELEQPANASDGQSCIVSSVRQVEANAMVAT